MNKIFGLIIATVLYTTACSYDFPVDPDPPGSEPGSLQPGPLVVIGGSISAGFMDGALYSNGQEYAYATQIAENLESEVPQLEYAAIPLNSEAGYNGEASIESGETEGKYHLLFRSKVKTWPTRISESGESISPYEGGLSGITNFSIPGLRISQLDDAGALTGNPYFDRLQQKQEGQSLLDLALDRSSSLVIMEVGTEDVFRYAQQGALGTIYPAPEQIGEADLVSSDIFEAKLRDAIQRILLESEADVFLLNIPDPFKFPFFSQIPFYFDDDEWQVIVEGLELIWPDPRPSNPPPPPITYYDSYNVRIGQYNRTISPSEERRPVIIFDYEDQADFRSKVIVDEDLPEARDGEGELIPKYRQMTKDDYFLYSANDDMYQSFLADMHFGGLDPIEDGLIITEQEAYEVTERRNSFNAIISTICEEEERIHLVDFEGLIERIYNQEMRYEGVTYSILFDNKSVTSADGYTLNRKGQALLANEIINQLNIHFDADIQPIDVNSRAGVEMKNGF